MSDLRPRPPRDFGTSPTHRDARHAEELEANPGMWARVRTCKTRDRAQSAAHRLRSGRLASFRRGFLAEAITTEQGRHEVWACYRPGLADQNGNS